MLSTSLLARIGHPPSHRHKVIALIRAYFDETGIHNGSEATVVCGIVAPEGIWDDFDFDWKKQLNVFSVPYFHAVECEHAQGAFQSLQRPLRDSLVWGLADVIGKHRILILNAGVSNRDWENFPHIWKVFKSPFHLCFAYCLEKISNWSNQHADGEPVALIFSEQNEYRPNAEKIYDAYIAAKGLPHRLVSLQFSSMKDFAGLQGADLVCYETYQHLIAGSPSENEIKRVGQKRLLNAELNFASSDFSPEFWAKALGEMQELSPK